MYFTHTPYEKTLLRQRLDEAIEAFLAKGGIISIIPVGQRNFFENRVENLSNNPKSEHYLPPMTPQEKYMYRALRKRGLDRMQALRGVMK